MLKESVPAKAVPSTAPNQPETAQNPSLAEVAAVLLPGLQHASALLATATKILSDLSGVRPQQNGDAITEAMKAWRLLAAFGRVPTRR